MTADNNTATAYPLSWPFGWPRAKSAKTSDFGAHSIAECVNEIRRQLRLLGANNVVISTNLYLRLDGLPRSAQPQPRDRGVAVYFKISQSDRVLACDRWSCVEDNLWSIAKHIDALRGQQRWGVGSVEQAFAGYQALPAPSPADSWWTVLDINRDATVDQIKARWRELARRHHPDIGVPDDTAVMARINVARDQALKERG